MLNKAIEQGKEKRKTYRKAKAVSRRCRNHGDCSYCRKNEQHNKKLGKGKSDALLYERNIYNRSS